MHPRVPCEFFLVRYVPDIVKGEFVNIGVLLREATEAPDAAPSNPPPMRVRFTRDWSRVRCMDASADIALLEDLEQEITRRLTDGPTEREPASLLAVLEASLSNSIQMTEPRAALAENLSTELEQLMRLYVEPMAQVVPLKPNRKSTGRPAILAAMRTHFERAGVWQLMNKRIPAERYTRKGDPLKLDCGYRRDTNFGNGSHIYQAVSLEGDVESAKVLAFMAPQLRAGVLAVDGSELQLTAVVEPLTAVAPEEGEMQERYRFGIETMEQQDIRVIPIERLAQAAATARHELGL
jgi:hypothetical protein